MGQIQINTPTGPALVNIAGDTPTEEEQKIILENISKISPQAPSSSVPPPQQEDISNYYRRKFALESQGVGGVPKEGAPKEEPLKDPDVDYTSGLRNLSVRAGFSNKELDSEKAAYLKDVVGEKGFRQDKGGRFIITKEGRKKLDMGEGPEVAIDEEGFSKYDLVDFGGEVGIPLTFGITAGVLTAGMATLPAMAFVGGSMALGKAIDETLEYVNGYQRQDKGQLAADVAWEGAMGFLGEGLGRGVSRVLGRFLKGSGGEAAEQGKVLGREMLAKGYRPTIEGAAPGAFSILGRAQAIYEGVIPNKGAAIQNLNALKKDLIDLGAKDDAGLTSLMGSIKKDIEKIYGTPAEKLAAAQRVLGKEIEEELVKIMAPLKQGRDLSVDLIKALNSAKESFHRQADGLFLEADKMLGEGNKIIPIGDVNRFLYKMKVNEQTDEISKLLNPKKPVGRILTSAYRRAEAEVKRLNPNAKGKELQQLIEKRMFITTADALKIRVAVSDLSFNPSFISTVGDHSLDDLSKTVNQAFIDAEGLLSDKIFRVGARQQDMLSPTDIGPRTVTQQQLELQKGLRMYQEARAYYSKGLNRFKAPHIQSFVKNVNRSPDQTVSVSKILDDVVKPNDPESLTKFLRAIKGIRPIRAVEPEAPTVRYAEQDLTIPQAKAKVKELEAKGVNATSVRQGIQEAEKDLASRQAFKISSGTAGESMRKQLAAEFINRVLTTQKVMNLKDGVEFLDGRKIAGMIDNLGETKKVLFRGKGELEAVEDLMKIFRSTGAEMNREVFEQFADRPLVEAIRGVKAAVLNKKAVDKDSLMEAFNTGNGDVVMDKLFAKGNARLINDFMENNMKFGDESFQLPKHAELKESVENAAMARILRSLGDVNEQTFADNFLSGRLGNKLQKVLADDYGKDTITAMFGKERSDYLFQMADIMKRASQQPMAGKGGLAPATIALSLTAFSFAMDPITTGGALLFYTTMSHALRMPSVLKMITASRKPGEDTVATALRDINTAVQKANLEGMSAEEGYLKTSPETQRSIQQSVPRVNPLTFPFDGSLNRTPVPNVQPTVGTGTPRIDPTNPIVNPDPQSQALAQAMASRGLYR